MFEKNIGTPDRVLRFVLGVVFLALAWFYSSLILLIVAAFLFFEAAVSWCALFAMLGKSTCEK